MGINPSWFYTIKYSNESKKKFKYKRVVIKNMHTKQPKRKTVIAQKSSLQTISKICERIIHATIIQCCIKKIRNI